MPVLEQVDAVEELRENLANQSAAEAKRAAEAEEIRAELASRVSAAVSAAVPRRGALVAQDAQGAQAD